MAASTVIKSTVITGTVTTGEDMMAKLWWQ